MEEQWITDRLPTKADGDRDGVVRLRHRVGFALVHWSHIGSGAPWQHTSHWKPSAEPETTEPDRIAALEPIEVPAPMRQFVVQIAAAGSELYALCDDDTIWILSHPSWIQLPAIPQPEA